MLLEEGDVKQRCIAIDELEDDRLCDQMISVLGLSPVIFQIRQPLCNTAEDAVHDVNKNSIDDLKGQPAATRQREGVAQGQQHRDRAQQRHEADGNHCIAEEHLPNPLPPWVMPFYPARDRVDSDVAPELWPNRFGGLHDVQRAPAQRMECCCATPEVAEGGRPSTSTCTQRQHKNIVRGTVAEEEVQHQENNPQDSWRNEPMNEVRNEQEVHSHPLAEVVPNLIHRSELPSLVQREVV
mmetsp:Transcript_22073/g.56463  ORF Transcript_22073/g.56463 Transcript_22073/m.56463 type:complete len:239 (+) Transcript_22073:1013-1729(+)